MTDRRPRTALFFDSGIGGLSVLREARVLMPDWRFVYVADDAAFPYGAWEEDALREHITKLFSVLLEDYRPALSVIACNTASTLAIDHLREVYPDETFVGTVPAIKPAAERTRSGLVSVLATPGTVKRQYTRELIRQYAQKCHVRLVGSDNLAAMAETYMRGTLIDEEALRREIEPCFRERTGGARISSYSPARIIPSWSIASARWPRGRSTGSIHPRRLRGAPKLWPRGSRRYPESRTKRILPCSHPAFPDRSYAD